MFSFQENSRKSHQHHSERLAPFSLMLIALISISVLAVSERLLHSIPKLDYRQGNNLKSGQDSLPLQGSQDKTTIPSIQVQAVRITIRPTGFEPNEITYPARPFLLAIDNQSGLDQISLQLEQVVAVGPPQSVHNTVLSLRKSRKREITNLPPGQYVLKEANHPTWLCRITINPL